MRKSVIGLGVAWGLLVLTALTGCGAQQKAAGAGTAPNEVLTLTEIPEDKMLVTVRVEDGVEDVRIKSAIETHFPEVSVVTVSNTPSVLAAGHDDLQDIILATFSGIDGSALPQKLLDLSGESFTQNYHISALGSCSVNGALPFLPGPSNVYGIVYDKELFAGNGWEVPDTLDGFIELCRTIESTGIRAVQPALHYTDATRQFFMGFNYQDLFSGVENHNWIQSYGRGEVSMAGHIASGFDRMKRLLDAGILQPEDFEIHPSSRSRSMYRDHTCAMILETQLAPVYAVQYGEGRQHEVGMMPFFSGGEGSDYLFSVPNFYIGINARLAEQGSEEKLAKALDILEWLSTVEGQEAIINPAAPTISSVKGVSLYGSGFFSDVVSTIEKGHVVEQPFWIGTRGSAVDGAFREGMMAWSKGERTAEEVMAACDEARDAVLAEDGEGPLEPVGTVERTFTVMETSLYLAELFRQEMGADIGLCLSNSRDCGNNLKLYAGEVQYGGISTLDTYLDRCFQTSDVEDGDPQRQLMRMTVTGGQLLDLLNGPPEQYHYPDNYYVAAGLKIEFAPWAGQGNRYVSVRMADGSDLDPDASYTVAFWNGSVREEQMEEPQAVSEHTAAELLYSDLKARTQITPYDDGRFTLIWDR